MVQAINQGAGTAANPLLADALGSIDDPDTADAVGALVELFAVVRQLHRDSHGDSARAMLIPLVKHGPLRGRDLSESLRLDQSTVSRHLAVLETDGLVERSADPSDGRAFVVSATPAGREVAIAMLRDRVAQFADLLAQWPERDRRAFVRLAGRLAAELDSSPLNANVLDPNKKEDNS